MNGWHDGLKESDADWEAHLWYSQLLSLQNMSAFGFYSTDLQCAPIVLTYENYYLTCAHKSGRVRVPPSICSTHCSHRPSWDKPRVTLDEYLSSLSCVLVCLNGTITRSNWQSTTDWNSNVQNAANNPLFRWDIMIVCYNITTYCK